MFRKTTCFFPPLTLSSKMKISDAIKIRIFNLCKENKITINELATLSGIRATTIYSILNGKSNNPSFEIINKICIGLNITIYDFLMYKRVKIYLYNYII